MPETDTYLGLLDRSVALIDKHPRRAAIALPLLALFLVIMFAAWQAPSLISLYEAQTDREYSRQVVDEERERLARAKAVKVDELIRARLLHLRRRSSSSRAVIRALVFDIDQSEQVVGIIDVFESMDIRTERTGIRNRPLPLTALRHTLDYMLASDVPQCIARNVDDYEDEQLKAFLIAGNLRASVACPLRNLDGQPIGLLAVSIRTPLEENKLVYPMTRDAALELGAILTESSLFSAVMKKKMDLELQI